MNTTELIAAITVSAGLILAVAAQSQEETRVEMKGLPPAAQATIKQKIGSQQILGMEKEVRNGKERYDAVVDRDGEEVGVRVDPNGNFLGTHREKIEQRTQSKS